MISIVTFVLSAVSVDKSSAFEQVQVRYAQITGELS